MDGNESTTRLAFDPYLTKVVMLTLLEYLLLAIFVAVLLAISRWVGHQAYFWMPVQGTAEAQRVDELFSFLFQWERLSS